MPTGEQAAYGLVMDRDGPVLQQRPSDCWGTVMLVPGRSGTADGWMLERLAHELLNQGLQVIRFNFRSVRQHLRGEQWADWPKDTTQSQILEFRQQVLRYRREERERGEHLPLLVGGYSRGGLIATLIADLTSAAGSFALGFPFHPPGNTNEWRSAHLASAIKPVLLINGDQDPYGTPQEIEKIALASSVTLHWLPERDHGMTFAADSGRENGDSILEMANLIAGFFGTIQT
jgi:predicted alpha/beta-hydrolase family hydrolase